MGKHANKYGGLLYSSFLMVLVFSCQKNIKDEYPEESGCEQYVGLYVYDPEQDEHYQMTVSCSPSNGTFLDAWDSVNFSNYANLFSVSNKISDSGNINGSNIHPLTDKFGNKWNFSNVSYPDTLNRINVLIGDSIYLYMNIDNTAFWVDDGVPYQSITTVHPGVKIH